EEVIWAVQLAVDYRQTYQQDVLIDLYCYRKYGHNEGDEPAFTQPKMYEVIRRKKPPREVYARRLAEEGVATDGEADELMQKRMARLEEELEHTRKEGAHRSFSAMAGLWSKYRGGFDAQNPEVPTNVPDAKLRQLLVSLSRLPADFTPNDKIAKLLEGRRKIAEADMPEALCVWEAQFGDFANGAQVVIDQFISSAEDKWNRLSGITLLLPHGFEGQGPEHSSARLERFLQLCAEDNMQVCFPTTPAQMFHLLRRQVLRTWRKPLVVMTPKSLLRHKAAVSTLDDLSKGAFRRILWDNSVKNAKRVLLCTGKVYYDLVA